MNFKHVFQLGHSTTVRTKKLWFKNLLRFTSKLNPMLGAEMGMSAFFTPLSRKTNVQVLPEGVQIEKKTIHEKKITLYKYGNSPRKILLVHGWEGATSDFSHFFEPLKEKGFEVIAIDLPGHGLSPHSKLNAVLAAKIIRKVELVYGPFSGIIGHSFGAFSTGHALSQYSEFEGVPFVSIGSPNKLKNILKNFSSLVGFSSLQKKYIEAKIERRLNFKIKDFEQGKFLKQHNGPILVVHDKKDKQVPFKVINEIKEETAAAQFLETEGLGHNRILKNKETIQTILSFLESFKDIRASFQNAFKFGFY